MAQLETGVRARETKIAKFNAEFDACIAALVGAANGKPREPGDE
jgi:hypothetical protein